MRSSKGIGSLVALNFDGVVANVSALVLDRLNHVFHRFDQPVIDLSSFNNLWGLPLVELVQRASNCSNPEAIQIAKQYLACVDSCQLPAADSDANEIIDYLMMRPAQLACLSLYLPRVKQLLGATSAAGSFDYVSDSCDGRESQIAKLLETAGSADVWLISDRVADIKLARGLGIGSVAATWGHDDEWDMALHSPDYIISDKIEAMEFIAGRML